jgi:hypothetical protein
MNMHECDLLFDHTKKLRIRKDQSSIDAKAIVKSLMLRWTNFELNDQFETPAAQEDETRRFLKDLQELVDQDENPITDVGGRPIIRDERCYSPPPVARRRCSPPRYISRHRDYTREFGTSKTEYWRPWGEQTSALYSSLKLRGWQPVYMRGTDAGQTWFYGPEVVHVRRFKDDYTPQDGLAKTDSNVKPTESKSTDTKAVEYLIVSTDWIEEEALQRIGFQYQLLPSGYFSLDPRITWGDIELLTGATSTFREERLYRKYRNLPGGDLHESHHVAVPNADFLHGPKLCDLGPQSKEVPRRTASGSSGNMVHRGVGDKDRESVGGNHPFADFVEIED